MLGSFACKALRLHRHSIKSSMQPHFEIEVSLGTEIVDCPDHDSNFTSVEFS